MASSRQARMQERMRGAQRHQVEDISFGFDIPADEDEPQPGPTPGPVALVNSSVTRSTRSTPNTSAKRKPLEEDKERTVRAPSSGLAGPIQPLPPPHTETLNAPSVPPQRSVRKPHDVYSIPESNTEDGNSRVGETTVNHDPPSPAAVQETEMASFNRVEQLPKTAQLSPRLARESSRTTGHTLSSPAGTARFAEEVTESPADAPGSGHRRRIRLSDAADSSTVLQRALLGEQEKDTGELATSSPLARKSRKGAPEASAAQSQVRRGVRLSAGSTDDQADEIPQLAARLSSRTISEIDQHKSPTQVDQSLQGAGGDGVSAHGVDEVASREPDVAEDIDEEEAARRIGRKRPRRSHDIVSKAGPTDNRVEAQAPRRRRKRPLESPAKQQQPKPKKAKNKPAPRAQRQDGTEEDGHVEVTVQRFTKRRKEEEGGADILNSEIPFTRSGAVNAIDFLAQMCEEIISSYLGRLADELERAKDSASRREYKTMIRALEAFQAELRTRLLEHTIALDSMCSLQKRIRAAQREKLSLREDILRIRAEREQVALRMDAIRIKHEADSKVALRCLSLSSTMHDIDLVTEKGQEASEFSPAEQKTADLANLELLVSMIADQACSKSSGGGALKQIKDFNTLLERTATALESR